MRVIKVLNLSICLIMVLIFSNTASAKSMLSENSSEILLKNESLESIVNEIDSNEMASSAFNDFITELKPFLAGVIEDDIEEDHVFTAGEIFGMFIRHPIRFLVAIYKYVIYSIKDIFSFANDNASVTY